MTHIVFEAIHAFLGLSLRKEWDKGTKDFVFIPLREVQRERILKKVQKEGVSLEELYGLAEDFFEEESIYAKLLAGGVARYTFQERYDLKWEF